MIDIYTPRKGAPEANNPYYNKPPKGYSSCILGNYPYKVDASKRTGRPGMNVLPNCVGYMWGRVNEIGGYRQQKFYVSGNAKDLFLKMQTFFNFKMVKKPVPGAVICWTNNDCGHVAVIEEVYEDDYILVSESGWSSTRIAWTAIHEKGKNNQWTNGDDKTWMKCSYTFQGILAHPDVSNKAYIYTNPYKKPTKAFQKGAKGDNVKWLQWHLKKNGYDVEIDGSFGPNTDKYLRLLQSKELLVPDGSCGPKTIAKLSVKKYYICL